MNSSVERMLSATDEHCSDKIANGPAAKGAHTDLENARSPIPSRGTTEYDVTSETTPPHPSESFPSTLANDVTARSSLASIEDRRVGLSFEVPADFDFFELADIGMAVVDTSGSVRRVNESFARVMRIPRVELINTRLSSLTSPEDVSGGDALIARLLAVKNNDTTTLTKRYLDANADVVWVDLKLRTLLDAKGDVSCIFVQAHNVTNRHVSEATVAFERSHDFLTGLANRASFLGALERRVNTSRSRTNQIAVLVLNVDDFKYVNDSLGHALGDELLIYLSRRLIAAVRVKDMVARIGGDEFAVLIEANDARRCADELAHRIAKNLSKEFSLTTHQAMITVSIGIAVGDLVQDASALLADADLAMCVAKKNGKGRHEFAEQGMRHAALQRLETFEELRRGVERDEFEVYYQAIVDTQTSTIAGAEALVRWNHPTLGLVAPHSFIDLAETNGLINVIGQRVRRDVCSRLAAWRHDDLVSDDFFVSVNLSPRELDDPTLVACVVRDLDETALPANALVLEITETTVMRNFDVALSQLRQLRTIGLRLALDDYGTGYSSLARLSELPIDIIKIAKPFSDSVTINNEGRALVQSIIDAALALGKITIAEGVEEDEQREALLSMGCNFIQGYLFSEPLSSSDVEFALRTLRPRRDAITSPTSVHSLIAAPATTTEATT